MKAKLLFDMDDFEDQKRFKRVTSSDSAYGALWDIAHEVFRPARKHGYRDTKGGVLDVESWDDKTHEVVAALEKLFYQILEDKGVDIDDYN